MRLLRPVPYLALLLATAGVWMAWMHERAPLHELPTLAFDQTRAGSPAGAEIWAAGVLLDDAGAPLVMATIAATQEFQLGFAHTDEAGRFEITGPRLNERSTPLSLDVIARGFPPVSFEVARFDVQLELQLVRPWPDPPKLDGIPTAELSVHVNGSAAGGYAGYELLLLPLEARSGAEDPTPTTRQRALVDESGNAKIAALTLGTYEAALLPPWSAGGSWPNLLATSGQPGPTITHAESSQLELKAIATSAFGTVSVERESRQEALEGALVLIRSATAKGPRIWPHAESDSRGSFAIHDLPPGSYELTIQAGRRRIEQELVITAGEPVELGRIVLPAPDTPL